MAKRRTLSDQFKAEEALVALRDDKTVRGDRRQASVASKSGQHMEAPSHRRDGGCVLRRPQADRPVGG